EPEGVEIHAKLERFNPGGSVKDRAALQIFKGALPPQAGRALLDSTSGHTGLAYARLRAPLRAPHALLKIEDLTEWLTHFTHSFQLTDRSRQPLRARCQFLEQPNVFDGDDCLRSRCFEELALFLGNRASLLPRAHDRSDRNPHAE